MANLKHIGQVANTGQKCIVVFREMYDENVSVLYGNHCLVVETERLPDMEHDDLARLVESPSAQEAKEFYEVLHRNLFSDGTGMLTKLRNMGYLRKYPTSQIHLTPNSYTSVKLSEVNEVLRKQASGMSSRDIQNTMVDDTDSAPRNHTSLSPSLTIDQQFLQKKMQWTMLH